MNSQPACKPPAEPEAVTLNCPMHGAYEGRSYRMFADMDPITSACPKCQQEARERSERDAREERERHERATIAGLLHHSGIPARYIGCTLENFTGDGSGQRRARELAARYVESFPARGASLVLCGKPGTGKTHIACAIGQMLIERKQRVVFETVIAAIRSIKDTYRKDSERSEQQAVNEFIAPDLLILDEVGAQFGTEHEKLLLFEIINERYQACRATILISNLTREELSTYLGDRVMDRFRETGAVVAFDWASHRGKRA